MMPGKYLDDMEKSKILTLKEENVSLLGNERCMGCGIATMKRFKSATAVSPAFDVPLQKLIPGWPRKTDKLLRREIFKNPGMKDTESSSRFAGEHCRADHPELPAE